MIIISKLTDSDKKRNVTFQEGRIHEHGKITSWNNSFIFVDFNGDGRGHACKPEQLTFDI